MKLSAESDTLGIRKKRVFLWFLEPEALLLLSARLWSLGSAWDGSLGQVSHYLDNLEETRAVAFAVHFPCYHEIPLALTSCKTDSLRTTRRMNIQDL